VKLIKCGSKDFNCYKIVYLKNAELSINKKCISFHKNIKQHNIDDKEMFLVHQISILDWFLKDHVTRVIMLKI